MPVLSLGTGLPRTVRVFALDAAASDFFTRASISDSTQRTAVIALVAALKTSGVWDKIDAFYPFVGGSASSHSHNLKSSSFQITWNGTVTHNSNGITGDAATGYGNTGYLVSTHGAQDSVHLYAYNRTTAPTDGGCMVGAVSTTGGTCRLILRRHFGDYFWADGIDDDAALGIGGGISDFRGSLAVTRTASNAKAVYHQAASNTAADVSVTACSKAVQVLARGFEGFANDQYTNANLAAVSLGRGLSGSDFTALKDAVQAYQTTLGRNV